MTSLHHDTRPLETGKAVEDAAKPAVRAAINSVGDLIMRRHLLQIETQRTQVRVLDAGAEDDMTRNTDLFMVPFERARIACRTRTNAYLRSFGNEFTIRSYVPSGALTEIHKVAAGWGDFLFYGFLEPGGARLSQWWIGDLDVFRSWMSRSILAGAERPHEVCNGDGTRFYAFNLDSMPADFIVAGRRNSDNLLWDGRW